MGLTSGRGSHGGGRRRRAGQDDGACGRTSLVGAGPQDAGYPGNDARHGAYGYDSGGFGFDGPDRGGGWDGDPVQEASVPVAAMGRRRWGRTGRRRGAAAWLRGYRGLVISVAAV